MTSIEPNVASTATIDLNQVAVWIRVVDSGSFTAAARALGLPKSTVSRAVTRLEGALGLTLLQRTTRRLALTRAGERYLASAREALRTLDEARSELMSDDGALRGVVRMTAPVDPTGLGIVLAGSIASFSARYPDVFIDVVFTARRVDLIAEGIDFAIRAGKLGDSSLIARKIASDQLVLVAAPAYVQAHGVPRRFADLAQHKLLLFDARHGNMRLRMSGPNGVESVLVRGPINIDEMSFQLPLAEAGAGIAVIPHLLADESVRAGRLVRVLPAYTRRDASIYLVHPPQRSVPRRVALFRDHIYTTLTRQLARCNGRS